MCFTLESEKKIDREKLRLQQWPLLDWGGDDTMI